MCRERGYSYAVIVKTHVRPSESRTRKSLLLIPGIDTIDLSPVRVWRTIAHSHLRKRARYVQPHLAAIARRNRDPAARRITAVFYRSLGAAGDCTYAIIDLPPRVAKFLSSRSGSDRRANACTWPHRLALGRRGGSGNSSSSAGAG